MNQDQLIIPSLPALTHDLLQFGNFPGAGRAELEFCGVGLAPIPITFPAHSQHSVQPKCLALAEIPRGNKTKQNKKRDALISDWLIHPPAM